MPDPARQESPPPSGASLFPLIAGFMASQVIYVAARLGLADHLGDGAKSSDELARATGTHASSLRRLLRGLVVVGLLEETAAGEFHVTPSGALLRSKVPGSIRNRASRTAVARCRRTAGSSSSSQSCRRRWTARLRTA